MRGTQGIVLAGALIWALAVGAAVADPAADYPAVKRDVAARQAALNRAYRAARDDSSRAAVLAEARSFLEDAIVRRLLPPWLGTPWDYNGTSEQPGAGSIACGFFVTTVLRDAGFRIERARLARLPSEQLIRRFCDPRDVRRFSGVPAPDFVAAVQRLGAGLFIVGLDYHVGFLVNEGREVRFVHSTVVGAGEVVDEPALDSGPLVWSRYRVVARALSDRVVARWLVDGSGPARARAGVPARALTERSRHQEA